MKELNNLIEKYKNHMDSANENAENFKASGMDISQTASEAMSFVYGKTIKDLEQLRDKIKQTHTKEEMIQFYEDARSHEWDHENDKRTGLQYYEQTHGEND